MNFNNSRLVDHKPMKFGTFVPYMYRFVIIVKYLTNFFKLEWNLGIKFTLRFFFLSVYIGHWLCWGLTTHQPLWVILCRLPEKGRKVTEEIVEEIKERDREERNRNESEETEEIKIFPIYPYLLQG